MALIKQASTPWCTALREIPSCLIIAELVTCNTAASFNNHHSAIDIKVVFACHLHLAGGDLLQGLWSCRQRCVVCHMMIMLSRLAAFVPQQLPQ
jgi:hypothetical protein